LGIYNAAGYLKRNTSKLKLLNRAGKREKPQRYDNLLFTLFIYNDDK